ncbi:precorrin-3B synthase [Streptomyces tauricus]|uniref:cobalamin biosynthesis protein CobG n=1 Tax=Streptomyces tauricus TaxID=68274 RepID=UPI001679C72C|nr:cobalamin biosynthesis protein CobG [Streptomyces tauricus]GHA09846.1 precorrin-3B synthase [Streptomyces tauricus]
MLAAMSSAALRPSSQATAVSRDRGDACPGTLRLHVADDGALARVRIPGGVLTVRQAEVLADAALRLGDGDVHLTSRGNVQLRGLAQECGAELAELLTAAGLLPSRGHERVRNIVASPLSGLDGHAPDGRGHGGQGLDGQGLAGQGVAGQGVAGQGLRDVRPWLTALDTALCASEAAQALSGRFLFALDDGRGDLAGLEADVTVRATADGGAQLALGSADHALHVSARDAPRAALVAAEAFLEAERAGGTRAWRVAELALGADELTESVGHRLTAEGIGHERQVRETGRSDGPSPGAIGDALSVHVPLGRLSAPQWRELTRVAIGELRLTPWRGVVLPTSGTTAARRTEALARLDAVGLVTGPGSPWLRVGACIGRPGCAKSRADVRADATAALEATAALDAGGALDAVGAGRRQSLPLYWSGCERRCGHPRGERIDVVAAPEGGYRLSVVAPGHDEARTVPLDDPSRLAAALSEIT